jgi:hypothetical protein
VPLRQKEATVQTKLFLQILLTLGCLALAMSVIESVARLGVLTSAEGWWRGAMACWLLIVAIRMVYPAQAK